MPIACCSLNSVQFSDPGSKSISSIIVGSIDGRLRLEVVVVGEDVGLLFSS